LNRSDLAAGVRFMLGGAFFFSLMTLMVKWVGRTLPSHEIVLARGVVTLILSYGMVRRAQLSPWGTRKSILAVRGLLGFAALTCFYFAVTRLPLAEVTVLQYTSPIWTALIAVPLLGEPITARVFGACFFSLAGVLLIARPDFLFGAGSSSLDLVAVGIALFSAVLSSGAYVSVRYASKTEHTLVIIFYFALFSTLGAIPLAAPVALWPRGAEWLVLLGVGVTTQAAQICLTRGLSLVPAGRAITIGYAQILFAALWGVLFFSEYLDLWTILGTCLIIMGTAIVSIRGRTVSTPSSVDASGAD
jgi:drug/metabolite transporter (DMT)-like permease